MDNMEGRRAIVKTGIETPAGTALRHPRSTGTPSVVPGSAVRIDPSGTDDPGCTEVEITPRDMLADAISIEGSTR